MGFTIRGARAGEEERLVAMYEWLFAPPGAKPARWDPARAAERLRKTIAAPRETILVAADDGGALIGFCSAYLDLESVRFGQRCWVEDLAVDPQQRSGGVGAALLAAAKQWAREGGASHLELDSGLRRVDAHRFYEREGSPKQSYAFGWEL